MKISIGCIKLYLMFIKASHIRITKCYKKYSLYFSYKSTFAKILCNYKIALIMWYEKYIGFDFIYFLPYIN